MLTVKRIRWSPFFTGLSHGQIAHIARVAEEYEVEAGNVFFSEGDNLDTFYLLQEGSVDIAIGVPDREKEHKFVDQIYRSMKLEQINVSSVGVGDIFGWSALIPPCKSTASAIASTPCRVIAINCNQLHPVLVDDYEFAYKMALKTAQTIRSRLRDRRIESLAFVST